MTPGEERLPILIAGAGAIGGALIAGWRRVGAPAARGLMIRDPNPGPEARAAAGAILNPADGELERARTLIFAVKPQHWRAVAAELAPLLAPDAAIVSVAAGVAAADIAAGFGGRRVARVMPTLAVAIGAGSTALWSADDDLAEATAALFAPLGAVTRLTEEDLLHPVTAASGSGPA
jgi:pyrroline-5-carboxylate reductase